MSSFMARTLIAMAMGLAFCAGALTQTPSSFHLLKTIPLGGDGSWDYLRFDPSAHRLFIARSTRVMVVDLATEKLTGEISDTAGVHGVALVTELNRGVTSNGKANSASIFDLNSLKVKASVTTGEKPDSILYDGFSHLVMTMNGHANSATLIDVRDGRAAGEISLPGRPETAVSDGKGSVFVNLEDKGQIAVIDMQSRTVKHTWDLEGCIEPTGLAFDQEHGRLFSGCHSGILAVVDAQNGRVIQELPIGKGVDAVAFDPGLQTVLTSNGEGSISVIQQEDADHYHNRETVQTLPGAKTMALDPAHHLVYTVANREGEFVLLKVGL